MKTTTENIQSLSFIDENKQHKLITSFPKYLKSKRKQMIQHFGAEITEQVFSIAEQEYPKLVKKTPTFKNSYVRCAYYQALI